MKSKASAAVVLGLCLAAVVLAATGCLVMGGKSVKYGPHGAMVSEDTLEQIERGRASKSKLVALLGEPSNKQQLEDGTEIYKYLYTKETSGGVAVFLILAVGDSTEQRNELFFEIKDDVVVDWWKGRQDF